MISSTETVYLAIDNGGKTNPSNQADRSPIARCVYCGDIAKNSDRGDREWVWIHYCNCEGAIREKNIEIELTNTKNQIYNLQSKVINLGIVLEQHQKTRGDNMKYLLMRDTVLSMFHNNGIKVSLDEIDRFIKKSIMENKLIK
jgi:uncharacterized protein YwbE